MELWWSWDADKSNQASMDTKTVSKKLHAYVIFLADLSELMKIIVSPLFVIYLFIYMYISFFILSIADTVVFTFIANDTYAKTPVRNP